jgi:hypothetical protein
MRHFSRPRREITRSNGAGKVLPLVGPVTERLIARVAAAADRDESASAETKFPALLIHNFKITFDANGTVVEKRHFGACHKFLRHLTRQL